MVTGGLTFSQKLRILARMLELTVQTRDAKSSPEDMRASGVMPAVIYGPKEAPTSIAINTREFERTFREAGETTLVKLKGLSEDKDTLIHDVQLHPVTDIPLHADFYIIEKGKKVTLNIPLEFIGSAPAEKLGHIVVKALHEIEIEVAATEIPQQLEVDLSKLENVGDHIVVSDIKLPASAELQTEADEIIASVTAFVEEKEETPAPATPEGAAPVDGAAPAATEPAKE